MAGGSTLLDPPFSQAGGRLILGCIAGGDDLPTPQGGDFGYGVGFLPYWGEPNRLWGLPCLGESLSRGASHPYQGGRCNGGDWSRYRRPYRRRPKALPC